MPQAVPEQAEVDEGLVYPLVPSELWMYWTGQCWVRAVDGLGGCESYLVAFTESEARAAAEHQAQLYDCDCIPVRVK